MFLGTAICLFVSLVIVVACYRAMQRVTIIKGLNCTKFTTVFLQMFRSTVIVRLNCGAQWFSPFVFSSASTVF